MLTREQVIVVFTSLLGRVPPEEDIDERLGTGESLDDLLRMVLESEEYATRLRNERVESSRDRAVVNVFHPALADWGLPPGTRSQDGDVIVGREGWLFLCGGTNSNLDQHLGRVEMPPGWLEKWSALISRREELAQELGVAAALLVMPEKLAVYERHYPEELDVAGPRPVERLTALELPVIYPLEPLSASAANSEATYIRTDTHLTFHGNELVARAAFDAIGVTPPDLAGLELRSYPFAGDLGSKFDPEIVSIISELGSLHSAVLVEDNREQIREIGGHIGVRRVFRNELSRDPRTMVVFGDSFGYSTPHYQGLAWFLAQVFREVHFLWVPFGWDSDYIRRAGAEAVIVQGAERFLNRVPSLEIDAASLAEDTLRRRQPVRIEGISDG